MTLRPRYILPCALLFLSPAQLVGQSRIPYHHLPPVDQASRDPAFATFRERLLQAVKRGDAAAIRGVISPQVQCGFGHAGGISACVDELRLADGNSVFWQNLAGVLEGGGVFRTDRGVRSFHAPYFSAAFPTTLDPLDYWVVVGAQIPVRSRPDPRASVVMRLSYHVVPRFPGEQGDQADERGWIRIGDPDCLKSDSSKAMGSVERMLDGSPERSWPPLFVEARQLVSPLGYRASFVQEHGAWMLASFLAGD